MEKCDRAYSLSRLRLAEITILRTFSFLVPHSNRHLNLIRLGDFTIPTASRGGRESDLDCGGRVLFRSERQRYTVAKFDVHSPRKSRTKLEQRDWEIKRPWPWNYHGTKEAERTRSCRASISLAIRKYRSPAVPRRRDPLYSVLRSITGLYGSEARWYREALWATM